MKKKLFIYFVLTFCFLSCDKENISFVNGEKGPVSITINVLDKDSLNILNDSTTRSEYMKNLKIIYHDSVFSCRGENKYDLSMNCFNGINNLSYIEFWIKDYYNPCWRPYTYYAFVFGSFTPNENLRNETIILDWGNGDIDKITFSYTGTLYEWFLNGERSSNPIFYTIRE